MNQTNLKTSEPRQKEPLAAESYAGAEVGTWEIDLATKTVLWNAITRMIFEVDPDYQPAFDTVFNFFREGESRKAMEQAVRQSIEDGMPRALQVVIITLKKK